MVLIKIKQYKRVLYRSKNFKNADDKDWKQTKSKSNIQNINRSKKSLD